MDGGKLIERWRVLNFISKGSYKYDSSLRTIFEKRVNDPPWRKQLSDFFAQAVRFSMKCQACSREMELADSTKVCCRAWMEYRAHRKVHHLRATFTYEAGCTRGNDSAVQLPAVTCILHPPCHDDPLLSLSLSHSALYSSSVERMNFHNFTT